MFSLNVVDDTRSACFGLRLLLSLSGTSWLTPIVTSGSTTGSCGSLLAFKKPASWENRPVPTSCGVFAYQYANLQPETAKKDTATTRRRLHWVQRQGTRAAEVTTAVRL